MQSNYAVIHVMTSYPTPYKLLIAHSSTVWFSIIRIPMFLKLGKSVQISEFVRITEAH